MFRVFLNSKIRDIRITGVNLEYEGSITLDESYLEQAGILPFEEVHVLNADTGSRLITYAIKVNGVLVWLSLTVNPSWNGWNRIMVLTYHAFS